MDTSFFTGINWLAVICAGLAYFALGALWYSKILFANKWIALTRVNPNDPEATKGMAGLMIFSALLMMANAFGLALLQHKLHLEGGWLSGLKLGLATGLLFGATAISISYLYEKRDLGLHFVNGGYTVVGNIIAAIIICSWP